MSNFLFVDRVLAALKPSTVLPDPGGIKVQADSGSNATLRIEANLLDDEGHPINDDRAFDIPTSSTSDTLIRTTEIALNERDAHIGTGVTNLVIRTNDFQASNYWPTFPNPGSRVSVSTLADGIFLTVDTGDGTYDKVILGSSSGLVADQATIITGAGHDLVTARGSTFPYADNSARKLTLKSLSMGSPATGKLDLKDNVLIVDYTGSSPLNDIQGWITSAYNTTAFPNYWTGNGLGSSTAAAVAVNGNDPLKKGVGYAENNTGSGAGGLGLSSSTACPWISPVCW